MKDISIEQVEHLERISMGIERIEKSISPKPQGLLALIEDVKWMAQELRTAWKKIEDDAW